MTQSFVIKFLACFLIQTFIIIEGLAAQYGNVPGEAGSKPLRSALLEVGYATAVVLPSLDSTTEVTESNPAWFFGGIEATFQVARFRPSGMPTPITAYLFGSIHAGQLQFTARSEVGEHQFTGDEQFYIGGAKLGGFPIGLNREIWMSPFIKIGGGTKLNTSGAVTYPNGPREFNIGSLDQTFGLWLGLGLDFNWGPIALSPEFAWSPQFGVYQRKRYYTFIESRNEFDQEQRSGVKDVQLSEFTLNTFHFYLSVRYRIFR